MRFYIQAKHVREMRANLRYELYSFLDHEHRSFAFKRLELFKQTDQLLTLRRSLPKNLQPRHMNAFLYARFRVTRGHILAGDCNTVVSRDSEELSRFLRSVDEEQLKQTFAVGLDSVESQDVYMDAIFSNSLHDKRLRVAYQAAERSLYTKLDQDRKSDIWERFVMHNEESLRFCKKRLSSDIRRLEKWSSRIRNVMAMTSVQFGGIVSVVHILMKIIG